MTRREEAQSSPAGSSASLETESVQAVSHHELLAVLDREIDESHRQATHSGWTPWALMTGLTALLWTFIDRIERLTSDAAVFSGSAHRKARVCAHEKRGQRRGARGAVAARRGAGLEGASASAWDSDGPT